MAALTGPVKTPGLFDAAQGSRPGRRDGLGQVVSTDSRVLFQALAAVYTDLGFGTVDQGVFADLVIARIVEPTRRPDPEGTGQGGGQSLDEAALARARRLAGLKGYLSNIPATVIPAGHVISSYHDL